MGGGFPAAAFGGRADVMAMLSPDGPVYQAGTLSGNPVATTAGLATLRLATDEVYAHVDAAATTISSALGEALTRAGVPHVLQSRRQHVQRLLQPEGRDGARLRRRLDAGHDGLPRVLPRHARPGRLPAAERVRGVVPLRRPRRPGDPARARRASRSGRGCRCAWCRVAPQPTIRPGAFSEDDGAPAAPRRGAQPGGDPLRTRHRVPPLRARPGDGRPGRRADRRPRHHPRSSPRRSSGPRRRRRRWPPPEV